MTKTGPVRPWNSELSTVLAKGRSLTQRKGAGFSSAPFGEDISDLDVDPPASFVILAVSGETPDDKLRAGLASSLGPVAELFFGSARTENACALWR